MLAATAAPTGTMMPAVDVLVIGCGNSGRGDDGIGQEIAAAIAARQWPCVRTISVHQLLPELAELLTTATMVIFIDAAADLAPGEVRIRAVHPDPQSSPLNHAAEPGRLLALARTLFGSHPRAWEVTVGVADLRFGGSLSPQAQAAKTEALERIAAVVAAQQAEAANRGGGLTPAQS